MKVEEAHVPPWHKWWVAGYQMKEGVDGFKGEGRWGQLDFWLTFDLGPQMLARPFCLIGLD